MGCPDWVCEILAEEQGLFFCPIRNEYTSCNNDCDHCEDAIEFEKCLKDIHENK